MFAFPVCEPAGTSFDQLFNTRVPYIGWQWYGDYDNDRQVGRTDHYSMRLTGPARVSGQLFHHMIDGNASRYLCTFWLKTQGVKGPLPVAVLQYPWNEEVPKDVLDTGLTDDNDWTEFSFVTQVPVITAQTYDSSEFILEHTGTGTVWLDDWSVRPLADDEEVTEKRPPAGPAPAQLSAYFLLDLPCDEGQGVGCLDASGHGNSLKLHGVTWATAGNRPVLHFEGEACAFVPAPSRELRPVEGKYPGASLTLEAWVRPAAGKGGGAILGYFNSPWLYLSPVGNDFVLNLGVVVAGKGETLSSPPVVTADLWTHVAATIGTDNLARLYVNGQAVAEKTLSGSIQFGGYWAMISVGTYGKLYGRPYTGDLAGIRWWSRAATPEELAAAAQKRPV